MKIEIINMKNKKIWIGVGIIVLIILAYFLLSGGKKEEKVSFETAKVEKQNISTSITATGTIEPVTSVTVGTQVSGIVSKLYVDYNSVVKKGQVMSLPTTTASRPYTTKGWSVPTSTRMPSSPMIRHVNQYPLPVRVCRRLRPTSDMPLSPPLLTVWYSPRL